MKRWLSLCFVCISSLGFSSQNSLSDSLEAVRVKFGAPSLAVVLIKNGAILEFAAVGERALGSGVAVQVDDTYHLGSISKSFTATVIAKLVEQKVLRWDATLPELFPNQPMLEIYKSVTLEQMLFHVAGFTANVDAKAVYDWNLAPAKARALYLEKALNQAPVSNPFVRVAYSNIGFVLASLAAEQESGQSWEALVTNHVFKPLEMNNCAFGTRFKALSQPHGHKQIGTKVVDASPELPNGNSNVLFGADGIRCSMPDFGKYLLAHLNGERGTDGIVSSDSFKYLHRARAEGGQGILAALGWFVFPNGALWHNGSNTLNFAEMIVNAKTNLAIGIATNSPIELGAKVSEAAMNVAVQRLR